MEETAPPGVGAGCPSASLGTGSPGGPASTKYDRRRRGRSALAPFPVCFLRLHGALFLIPKGIPSALNSQHPFLKRSHTWSLRTQTQKLKKSIHARREQPAGCPVLLSFCPSGRGGMKPLSLNLLLTTCFQGKPGQMFLEDNPREDRSQKRHSFMPSTKFQPSREGL